MINPVFLLSGLGMMLVGILPVMWWRYRTLVPWRDFRLGVLIWILAAGLKVLLDVSVTPLLLHWLAGIYTAAGIAIITGAYVGLRTGLFESGLTYLVGLKRRIARMDIQQAVSVGLGFGCAEAFLLGIIYFINVSVLLAFPQVIDLLPPVQRAALLEQLTLPSVIALAPVIERAAVLAVQVFCTVLVIQSLKVGLSRFFMMSFILRSVLDGALPTLSLVFDRTTAAGIYYIEAFIVIIASLSLVGMYWLKDEYGKRSGKRTTRKRLLFYVAVLTAGAVAASLLLAQPNVASKLERRNVNFDDFSGRYDFEINGTYVGYSEFEFAGGTEYGGGSAFVIKENTNLSSSDYVMEIDGMLYATVDARPLFYNMTIRKNGYRKTAICEFGEGLAEQSVTEGNETRRMVIPVSGDSFIIANNMISHWALLFRAASLEPKNTYIARLFSPNAETEIIRSLEVSGVDNIKVGGKPYEVYVFMENGGSLYYVTPEGVLLKMKNEMIEITLSDGEPEEGGIFR